MQPQGVQLWAQLVRRRFLQAGHRKTLLATLREHPNVHRQSAFPNFLHHITASMYHVR